MKIKTSRSRAVAAALTGMALVGGGAAVTTQAANAAPPTEDCKQPYPVANLAAEDAVTGLTVDTGTIPEDFTGEILGVINDGIAPGVDMIMARLTSDEIDRVGIWQGMSGSMIWRVTVALPCGYIAWATASWSTARVKARRTFGSLVGSFVTASQKVPKPKALIGRK